MLNVLKCLVMQLIWPDNIIKFVILGIKPAPTSFEIPSSHLATELLSPTPESPCCLLAFLGAEPRSPEPIFPCVRWKLPRSLYSSVLKFSFWTYLWPVLTLICNQPHPMSCFFFFFFARILSFVLNQISSTPDQISSLSSSNRVLSTLSTSKVLLGSVQHNW